MVTVKYTGGVLKKGTPDASGFDLSAADDYFIGVGERLLIYTGIHLDIPVGYEAQVRTRSGMAYKLGFIVLNSPGTIDSDYRGEVAVIGYNAGSDRIHIKKGDRIAQLVFVKLPFIELEYVDSTTELSSSIRGKNGFGSTGT